MKGIWGARSVSLDWVGKGLEGSVYVVLGDLGPIPALRIKFLNLGKKEVSHLVFNIESF